MRIQDKNNEKVTIFLSYCHKNKIYADLIDSSIRNAGYDVKRDIRDVGPWKSFKDFMNSIREQDFCIIIISEDYLKSLNCMYEMNELVKDDFSNKIIPIVLFDDIYKVEGRTAIIKYWEQQYKDLENQFVTVAPENSIDISSEMKRIKAILNSITDFLTYISSINNPKDNILEAILSKLPKVDRETIENEGYSSAIALPEFDIKIVSHNGAIPGQAEAIDIRGEIWNQHENTRLSVEMVSGKARNVTLFDKLIDSVMKTNTQYPIIVCYEDSPDARYRDKVHVINRTTYPADINGYPRKITVRYELHNKRYEQIFELRRAGNDYYYSQCDLGHEERVKDFQKIIEMKQRMHHDFLKSKDERINIDWHELSIHPMKKFKRSEVLVRSIYGHDFIMNSDGCFGVWEIYDFDDDGLLVYTGDKKIITLRDESQIEASVLGCISFEIINSYDMTGDSRYKMPILYCDYRIGDSIFCKYEYIEKYGLISAKDIVNIQDFI